MGKSIPFRFFFGFIISQGLKKSKVKNVFPPRVLKDSAFMTHFLFRAPGAPLLYISSSPCVYAAKMLE